MFDLTHSPEGVAFLRLEAPQRLNALRLGDWTKLATMARELAQVDDLRAVVLSGAGDKAFCAGGDIKEFSALRMGAPAAQAYNHEVDRALAALADIPVPTIAKIHASCFGGGLMLALACDLRWASKQATFCAPPAKMGFTYNMSAIARLRDLIGPAHTADLLYSARTIDAEEAARMGLINAATDDLEGQIQSFLGELLSRGPLAHRAHKRLLQENPAPGSLAEQALTNHLYDSQDYKEAVEAFAHRRQPDFKGT